MNDEERKADLDMMSWQIQELRLELARIGFEGEDAPGQRQSLNRNLANLEARIQEWRRP